MGESLLFVYGRWWPAPINCHHSPRLKDSDDVICGFLAFGAWFRTPVTLLLRKRGKLSTFHANCDYAVRCHFKCEIKLRLRSAVSDSCSVSENLNRMKRSLRCSRWSKLKLIRGAPAAIFTADGTPPDFSIAKSTLF